MVVSNNTIFNFIKKFNYGRALKTINKQ